MTIELTSFSNANWKSPLVRAIPLVRRRHPVGGAIYKTPPINNTLPVISGIPSRGQALTADTGGWSQVALAYHGLPLLNEDGSTQIDSQTGQVLYAAIFQWIWRRNGVVLPAAQGPTYTPVAADVGAQISVELWASNPVGSTLVVSKSVGPIAALLAISGTPVTSATHGTPYAGFTVSATGGWAPRLFNVTSGLLPPGITLSAKTGAVAGTPLLDGVYAGIVISVADLYGVTASLSPFTITVA